MTPRQLPPSGLFTIFRIEYFVSFKAFISMVRPMNPCQKENAIINVQQKRISPT